MDSTSEEVLNERKQAKLTQMSRRDEERKLGLQGKLATSTNVGRQYFEQEYPQMKTQIEELFEQLSLNSSETLVQELADRLQKLEKFLTEHVEILCSRDVANAQNEVLKLRGQLSAFRGGNLSSNPRLEFTKLPAEPSPSPSASPSSPSHPPVSSNTITLSNRQNELIRLEPAELSGKDVAIENLSQCEIFLKGVPSSLQIADLANCVLVVGPCARSILIARCRQSEFALACQQLRVHTSSECDFYVHITAQPIVEDCQTLRFAPYNVEYAQKAEHVRQSALLWTKDYWNDVRDFNHLALGVPSPNWEIIEEEERKEWSLD